MLFHPFLCYRNHAWLYLQVMKFVEGQHAGRP